MYTVLLIVVGPSCSQQLCDRKIACMPNKARTYARPRIPPQERHHSSPAMVSCRTVSSGCSCASLPAAEGRCDITEPAYGSEVGEKDYKRVRIKVLTHNVLRSVVIGATNKNGDMIGELFLDICSGPTASIVMARCLHCPKHIAKQHSHSGCR